MQLKDEDISMLKYFWEEKGDIKKYCEFNDLLPILREEHPEVIIALENYENSLKILNNVIKAL